MIPRLNPDVITLDVNMPIMDGLTALKHIMIKHPKPTVMLSTLTREGERVTFDALKYGAVDFIAKPSMFQTITLEEQKQRIIEKVKMAAKVELEAVHYFRPIPSKRTMKTGIRNCEVLVVIGVSAGGYNALLKVIPHLPADLPAAFLVIFYAPSESLGKFISYLDETSAISIKRAIHGEPLKGGVCYLATGDEYVTVQSSDGQRRLQVNPRPFRTHRGAINMLMFSVAETMKQRSIGIILSGSGEDGVEGLAEIIRLGGASIVQDPVSCLCREAPKAVLNRCKVDWVTPDTQIPSKIEVLLTQKSETHKMEAR
jgi:two-component system chemotaxis response regulator CheB